MIAILTFPNDTQKEIHFGGREEFDAGLGEKLLET